MVVTGVYCTMGHGYDLVHLDSKRVPKGCTYVTIGLSGMTSIDLPKILYAFQDNLLKDALQYPDDEKIHRVLTEYFRLPFETPIRVHNENDLYTDSIISLWTNAGHQYFKSGIYELGRPIPTNEPFVINHFILDKAGGIVMERDRPKTIAHPRDAPRDLCDFVYKGSIWKPKASENYNVRRHYSEIMDTYRSKIDRVQFPNLIFYHFACRFPLEYTHPELMEQVRVKRQQSINEITRKGVHYQIAQPIARPNANKPPNRNLTFEHGTFLQKVAKVVPYFESWVTKWASDTDNRSRWSSMISEALDDIKTRRSPEMNTATSASAAASSNQWYNNPFRQYSGIPSAAASATQFKPRNNMLHRRAIMSSSMPSAAASSADALAQYNNNMYNNNAGGLNNNSDYLSNYQEKTNPKKESNNEESNNEESNNEESNNEATNAEKEATKAEKELHKQLKMIMKGSRGAGMQRRKSCNGAAKACSSRKGGRTKRNTHRKKANRQMRKQTRKRTHKRK